MQETLSTQNREVQWQTRFGLTKREKVNRPCKKPIEEKPTVS